MIAFLASQWHSVGCSLGHVTATWLPSENLWMTARKQVGTTRGALSAAIVCKVCQPECLVAKLIGCMK